MDKFPIFYSLYDKPMWESIQQKRMALQRCQDSGEFYYPPGPICPESLSANVAWEVISGKGKLLSWAVFHKKYLPAYDTPHLVVAVELEEGPIMVGYMLYEDYDLMALDLPVQMSYAEHPDGYVIPYFQSSS